MDNVQQFISNHLNEPRRTFLACVELIIYGYNKLAKEKTYSRKDILVLTQQIRKKETNKIDLEDFLRNDLIANYINPNKERYNLNFYDFASGVEEFTKNIKTGILDIKVCSPLLNGETYFIFECKRLNKSNLNNYVNDGVTRFVLGKYYPESETSIAGMIGFLEADIPSNRINLAQADQMLNLVLVKYSKKIRLVPPLSMVDKSSIKNTYPITNTHVFKSNHKRTKRPEIDIYHIILDYNDLVLI